jgi:hypothetical protein
MRLADSVAKIALSTTEPALMLERLFLVEVKGPESKGFVKSEATRSIKAMGSVVYNRACAQQLGYTFVHYPTSCLGVVTQKNQFAGFQSYDPGSPTGGLGNNLLTLVNTMMEGANYPGDQKHYSDYVAVVNTAKSTALEVINGSIVDPFAPNRTFSWRKSGSSGPGGSFSFLGPIAGNDFYGFGPIKTK